MRYRHRARSALLRLTTVGALGLALAAIPAGTGAAAAPGPALGGTQACVGQRYWLARADGAVADFGCAPDYGSLAGVPLAAPIVAMTAEATGYRLAGADGGVFDFGSDPFEGSLAGAGRLSSPVVAMADAPGGRGYWLLARDGAVYSFGDAAWHRSAAGVARAPVVAIAPTPASASCAGPLGTPAPGRGYWLAARDGNEYAFGDAAYQGRLTGGGSDVVAMAAPPGPPGCPAAAAVSTYDALQRHLYLPAYRLYRGSGTTFSYLWPLTNATAATVYLAALTGGAGTSDVAARLAGLGRYLDAAEASPAGNPQPPAFESAPAPPLSAGGDTYYDDNAWVALDLVQAYRQTGDADALFRAEQVFSFLETWRPARRPTWTGPR